jgi:hypothetical protein
MLIPEDHVNAAVQAFGYSEREARFLGLVTAFSGNFLLKQWRAFARITYGKGQQQLADRLLDNGHANGYEYHGHHRYHVYSKPLYRVFGRENSNHRRRGAPILITQRLGALDFVLAHQDGSFLLSEDDRKAACVAHGITDPAVFPRRTYHMHGRRGASVDALFPDRFPMLTTEKGLVFTYIDSPLDAGFLPFRSHLRFYAPLLTALIAPWSFVFIAGREYKISAAERVFRDTLAGCSLLPGSANDPDLLRYFELELRVERKEWTTLLQVELVDRANLKQRFSAPKYGQLYEEWRAGKLKPAAQAPSHPLSNLREFTTFLAPTLAL